jgi:predicted nucleic acid-binding protein
MFLQRSILVILTACHQARRREMTKTWNTKFGPRRVRHDPPTLAEAVTAAQGLTDNLSEQVEIAASLIGLTPEKVRDAVMAAAAQRRNVNVVAVGGGARGSRSVIVERKPARRMVNR